MKSGTGPCRCRRVGRLDDYSAAVLLIQRAQHIKAGFGVSESERLELIQIYGLVEGVPRAIELAARSR